LLAQITLQRFSRTTITSARALRAELEEIERLGYATDREEFIPGMVAVAVPVRDEQQRVRAAIAMHPPSVRMTLEQASRKLPALRQAAERMRGLL
jgi:DNA-binding IclR family transcriptional regulator